MREAAPAQAAGSLLHVLLGSLLMTEPTFASVGVFASLLRTVPTAISLTWCFSCLLPSVDGDAVVQKAYQYPVV